MALSLKHLSSIANDVVQQCALKMDSSVQGLVEEFEISWKPDAGGYERKFVEFCSAKAVAEMCQHLEEDINGGSFSRFSFDMMLAWEAPSMEDEESRGECLAKGKQDKKLAANVPPEQDEIPLFYSDLMPLLVDDDPDVGEDAFVWLGSLVPLVSDIVNARFLFETLTAPTGNRLHFPAYDKFLKEIDKCIKHLQKQATPKGVELRDDEFILHVDGTASSQRVVRHIGTTSWPGRLTLTNYSLYFEASGVLTYENALKMDLSEDSQHKVKSASTGPWGAPLFDKAIVYESLAMSEEVVLEFPEITSSTRRDHWLALVKEIILLHQFLRKFNVENDVPAWEMHSRTILGIIRLHAARELLRISPPVPTKFLIFALCDELPKGDYVLEELADSLKLANSGHPCSATSILRNMNMSQSAICSAEMGKVCDENERDLAQSSLESVINQAREEEKEAAIAKATAVGLKDEGIGESAMILMELLKPLKSRLPWFTEVLEWKRPAATIVVLTAALIVTYKEWVGKAVAAFLLWVVAAMVQARMDKFQEKCDEIIVCTASNQSTLESIVSAQQSLQSVHEMVQSTNIAVLKIWSIFISKARKHADVTMAALCGLAVTLAVVPTKYMIMGAILYGFFTTSRLGRRVSDSGSGSGDRRLREWWDSIPVIRVRVVDELPDCPTN